MEQPKNSKVKITKTEDTLEIYIPPAKFRCYMTTVILGTEFVFAIPILLIAYGLYSAGFPDKIVFAIFFLPFLAGAVKMGAFLLYFLFTSSHIKIDIKQITITRKIFGSEIGTTLIIDRDKIEKLIRTESSTCTRNSGNKHSNGAVDQKADLIFNTETDEYKLREYSESEFPEPELNWLAYEISNFLDLPITYQSLPSN